MIRVSSTVNGPMDLPTLYGSRIVPMAPKFLEIDESMIEPLILQALIDSHVLSISRPGAETVAAEKAAAAERAQLAEAAAAMGIAVADDWTAEQIAAAIEKGPTDGGNPGAV